jgi:antibiotic biosynthesis monooxygenase (ABM) superfamily enzyme
VIVYEVNVAVRREIEADYRQWLDGHVREIVALPGFLGARVFERREPAAADGEFALCMQYRLRDAAALADYLCEHAPRLRADGIARFGDRFRAERRVLEFASEYGAPG